MISNYAFEPGIFSLRPYSTGLWGICEGLERAAKYRGQGLLERAFVRATVFDIIVGERFE